MNAGNINTFVRYIQTAGLYLINHLFYYIYYAFTSISSISLIHIYIIMTFLLLGTIAYIKLKHPFWSGQPCWHTYDYWRYLYKTPFIIQKSKPVKTKYLSPNNVVTFSYLDATESTVDAYIDLLRCFYIPSDKIVFTIQKKELNNIMTGHDGSPYLSIYSENQYILDSSASIQSVYKPIACMIAYPVHIYYLVMNSYTHMQSYYWDYVCIHRKYNHIRNLIQTHEYNQRIKSPDIPVSLFKKEISLCEGIIPFIKYKSYTYYLNPIQMIPLPNEFIILRIVRENISILFDFLDKLKDPNIPSIFTFYAIPSIVNITVLIESAQLYVYCLKKGEHIYGMYFIKKTYTIYEDIANGNTLQLIASINNSQEPSLFANGFIHSMFDLLKTSEDPYHVIVIDECSHNDVLLTNWNLYFKPVIENLSAYYFYNFVYPGSPLSVHSAFILL